MDLNTAASLTGSNAETKKDEKRLKLFPDTEYTLEEKVKLLFFL